MLLYFKIILMVFIALPLFSNDSLKNVSIQLNWKYQFEFAGFIAAKEKGFYKDIGLDVDILEYQNNKNIIDEVKDNKVNFGVYDASYLNLYDKNKPVLLLANYFKRPALVLITSPEIIVPEDLKGKKLMHVKSELAFTSIGTLLKQHNITLDDVTSIPHTFSAEKFINGEVDAFTAFLSNELYDVRESKVPYRIMDPSSYGINEGGLNLFTSSKFAKENPKLVQNFIEATKKGWNYALDNKEELVDIIYDKYSKLKTKDALLFEANETEKLMIRNVFEVGAILENIILDDIKRIKKRDGNFDLTLEELLFNKFFDLESEMAFTKEEIDYLKIKKEITMCIDPDWMPYEKIDENGRYIGMTSEFIPMISKKINTPITLVSTKNWAQSIEFAKQRKCDIFSLAMPTPSRLKYMNFTSAYITFPVVLASKTEELFIANPETIVTKKKIGIVKGYSMGEILKKKYPDHRIVDVESVVDGLKKVENGELFGFIGALPTVAYELQHKFLGTLKIVGKLDRNYTLGIGVRNDDENLFSILNKAVKTIDEKTRQEILNKYVSVNIQNGLDSKTLFQILAGILIFGVIIMIRARQLSKYNKALKSKQKELYETQKELELSVQNFEILLDSLLEAVFVFEEKKCVHVNNIGLKMFGYENKDEVLGKNIKEFVSDKSIDEVIKRSKYTSQAYEILGKKKNGQEFPVLVKGTNSEINRKKVRISALVDLSDLKEKDRLLFQQSKMASMGEMIENIAHQWRQPLSMISSISTGVIVKKELNVTTEDEEIENLEKINKTAQHLSQTIEDFRSYFRRDKIKSSFYILESIKKNFMLTEGILKSHNIKMIYKDNEDIKIENYENEFTQALMNIFSNAKDVLVKNDPEQRFIFIGLKEKRNKVIIEICDNGGGIKKDLLEKIFEPYFTTKHQSQGTGIGLYMTHQIIETHMNGTIKVKNESTNYKGKEYKGANFIITLSKRLENNV